MDREERETVVPAAPGWSALYLNADDEGMVREVVRDPVLAWQVAHGWDPEIGSYNHSPVPVIFTLAMVAAEPHALERPDGKIASWNGGIYDGLTQFVAQEGPEHGWMGLEVEEGGDQ